jgi:hypothetical protein
MQGLVLSWTTRSIVRRLSGVLLLLLAARSADALTVILTWDAPGDPTVVGYILSYGTASGEYTSHVDVGNAVTAQ